MAISLNLNQQVKIKNQILDSSGNQLPSRSLVVTMSVPNIVKVDSELSGVNFHITSLALGTTILTITEPVSGVSTTQSVTVGTAVPSSITTVIGTPTTVNPIPNQSN